MSYLEMKRVGRQGPTLGLFLLEVALVRNASRANGMRGMAQRISTTLQQQQTALLGLISYVHCLPAAQLGPFSLVFSAGGLVGPPGQLKVGPVRQRRRRSARRRKGAEVKRSGLLSEH